MALLLREEDVRALLPIADAIEALEWAFRAQAEGQATNVPRARVRWPRGALHVMAAGGARGRLRRPEGLHHRRGGRPASSCCCSTSKAERWSP